MTQENIKKLHELEKLLAELLVKVTEMEKHVDSLTTAVFKGDNRDHSIKDRIQAAEFELNALMKSINEIAGIMREQSNDKKKLMLVIVGGSLTFLFSAVLILVSNYLG